MSDTGFKSILKGASVVGVGAIFSKGISLVAEVLVAREIAATTFGSAIFAYTVLLTLSSVLLIGIHKGFTYRLAIYDERENGHGLFWTLFAGLLIVIVLLSSVFTFVQLASPSTVVFFGISDDQWHWIRLLSPLLIAYPISRLSIGILRAFNLSTPKALFDDILNKVLAGAVLIVVIWSDLEALIFISFYLLQYIFSGLLLLSYSIHVLNGRLKYEPKGGIPQTATRELLSYSWPLALKNLTRQFLGKADILLVGLLLTSSAVGYYRVGYTISQVGIVPLTSLSYLYVPRVTRYFQNEDYRKIKRLYQQATKFGTLLTLPVALPIIYYPDQLIILLFGEQYRTASTILLILGIDVMLRSATATAASTLQAIGHTKIDFVVTAVTSFLNLLLSYYLITVFGIFGAALGTLLSMLLLNIAQILLVIKFISIHPYTREYIISILLMITIGYIIKLAAPFSGVELDLFGTSIPSSPLIFSLTFLMTELIISWLTGLIDTQEKRAIQRSIKRRTGEL